MERRYYKGHLQLRTYQYTTFTLKVSIIILFRHLEFPQLTVGVFCLLGDWQKTFTSTIFGQRISLLLYSLTVEELLVIVEIGTSTISLVNNSKADYVSFVLNAR